MTLVLALKVNKNHEEHDIYLRGSPGNRPVKA